MAQNPLLGSRISLVSKKSIRYEGTLYSINESNATVALQNVRSYGTEGREKADPEVTFVAPQDSVHPYLLFRGCDIKDLHVHESETQQPPSDPAIMSANAPPGAKAPPTQQQPAAASSSKGQKTASAPAKKPATTGRDGAATPGGEKPAGGSGRGNQGNNRRQPKKSNNPAHQVGTGASLLSRKARGSKDAALVETPSDDFDFQTNLKEFDKDHEEEDEEAGDTPQPMNANAGSNYEKDDFFDSISCDTMDRQSGNDNRLRGATERNLNTETFGAVALNSQRNRRRRGPGRGGRGGRGRGRGGRGRGRGRGRSNDQNNNQNRQPQAAS